MVSASGSPDDEVHVELYVRSLSPRESRRRVERVVERLDVLTERGTLVGYRVVPTGKELPATRDAAITDYGEFLLNRVAAFERWAAATGRSLGSNLERRTIFSQFTDEEHDALLVPTMVMAEYEGGDLRFVTPCEDGDDRITVVDRLDALALEEAVADDDRIPSAGVRPPPGPTTPLE